MWVHCQRPSAGGTPILSHSTLKGERFDYGLGGNHPVLFFIGIVIVNFVPPLRSIVALDHTRILLATELLLNFPAQQLVSMWCGRKIEPSGVHKLVGCTLTTLPKGC